MPWTVNPDHGYLERFTTAGSIGALTNIDVDTFTPPGTDPVIPNGSDNITFTGSQVSSGTVGANVLRTHSLAASSVTYEIQQSGSAAAQDTTLNGVAHFNSSQFSVANGFVSLAGGGEAIDSIGVDANTAPGTNPVLPDTNGLVTVTGAQVAAGTVGANVIRSNSVSANAYRIEIQRSTSNATTDSTKNGIAHFNSSQFSVDSNGFVSLAGGGLAIDSIAVQIGTSPVTPTGAGLVTINGAVVAAGTNPVRSDGTGANTLALEVQISQAISATDATKIGLCNFNSSHFSVDANGFVSSIVGGFPWSDVSGAFSAEAQNGYFVTGTATGTLPASPSQGQTIQFLLDHGSQTLTIQASGTQIIRLNTSVTAAGGTAAATGHGASIELVYRASNTCWHAVDSNGNWVLT